MSIRTLFSIRRTADDRSEYARLEEAEREVTELKQRCDAAAGILDARRKRNHWRETVEQMIRGGAWQ